MSGQLLILRESDPPRRVRLPRAVADALGASEAVSVSLTSEPDVWLLSAARKVGVVKVGDLQVVIQPKIPMQRLLFLMGYARSPSFWRDERVSLDPQADLPEALAESFRRLATRATEQGLLKGYMTVDETASVLRGRIREADQVKRRFGRGIPLEVRYDDFTVDIAENQLLLAAAERLLRMPGMSRRTRQGLLRLRLQLSDVSPVVRGSLRPRWQESRLNARYVPALHLAGAILDGSSFEQRVGGLVVSGFLFDMWKIFEDFVCVALKEALRPLDGRSTLQHRASLDKAGVVPIRPDFVWIQHDSPRIVVDAKYKAEKPAGFPQADLYQVLAYCTVLGLADGHLVYAKGEEPRVTHHVVGAPVTIHCHTVDLSLPPSELLGEVQKISVLLRGSTPSGCGLQQAESKRRV